MRIDIWSQIFIWPLFLTLQNLEIDPALTKGATTHLRTTLFLEQSLIFLAYSGGWLLALTAYLTSILGIISIAHLRLILIAWNQVLGWPYKPCTDFLAYSGGWLPNSDQIPSFWQRFLDAHKLPGTASAIATTFGAAHSYNFVLHHLTIFEGWFPQLAYSGGWLPNFFRDNFWDTFDFNRQYLTATIGTTHIGTALRSALSGIQLTEFEGLFPLLAYSGGWLPEFLWDNLICCVICICYTWTLLNLPDFLILHFINCPQPCISLTEFEGWFPLLAFSGGWLLDVWWNIQQFRSDIRIIFPDPDSTSCLVHAVWTYRFFLGSFLTLFEGWFPRLAYSGGWLLTGRTVTWQILQQYNRGKQFWNQLLGVFSVAAGDIDWQFAHSLGTSLSTRLAAGCFLTFPLAFSGGWLPKFLPYIWIHYLHSLIIDICLQLQYLIFELLCGGGIWHNIQLDLLTHWAFGTWQLCIYYSSFWIQTLDSGSFNNTDRKPGPKPRRRRSISTCWLLLLLLTIMTDGRIEGCALAMEGAGASYDWLPDFLSQHDAKTHGTRPTTSYGSTQGLNPKYASQVVKRSLRRAHRRALQTGFAWYKGQCLVPEDFSRMGMTAPDCTHPLRPQDLQRCHFEHKPKKRIACLLWNGGGMANHRLDELKQWMHQQQIQIAVIPETRWSFQSEWSDTCWHHVHSADPSNRGSGVLVIVSKSLGASTDLRWTEVVPGRILHVRVLRGTRSIDIVGCYQRVHNRSRDSMQVRKQFWTQLEQHVSHIPHRNTLMLLGDMNCSLPKLAGQCGTDGFRWQGALIHGTQHDDATHFASIVKSLGLVALNTWNHASGPTYVHDRAASRIDFAFVRKQQADGLARQTKYVWEAPFLPLHPQGHCPIVCTIPAYWIPPAHQQQTNLTPGQRKSGLLARTTCTEAWQTFIQTAGEPICLHANFADRDLMMFCSQKHSSWQSCGTCECSGFHLGTLGT